ncbi:MAG TPA: RraA family protein [Thermodesulfobacteriota bacterium]|nr:RraA family protein [Thermodesulfobacteriota bacterium]
MKKSKPDAAEMRRRYLRLYTGVIADILDAKGVRAHSLPPSIRPIREGMKVAGPAFTCMGVQTGDAKCDDTPMLIRMLEAVTPHSVVLLKASGDSTCSHWGEIMTLSAKQKGCTGAVVDGGVRDAPFILKLNFPVFAGFYLPASSISRWNLIEFQGVIKIGEVSIRPGDYVFGDTDGIVVVPGALKEETLIDAEKAVAREQKMRTALRRGMALSEVNRKFGAF